MLSLHCIFVIGLTVIVAALLLALLLVIDETDPVSGEI